MFSDLEEIAAYFEARADAEYTPDSAAPRPNEEMRLLGMVEGVMREAKALLDALRPLAFSHETIPPPGVKVEDWREAVFAARRAVAKATKGGS